MKEMVKHVTDAGSYAPVTILIEKRPDSVRISYDTMASYLAPYGNSNALKVAGELDSKVERIPPVRVLIALWRDSTPWAFVAPRLR